MIERAILSVLVAAVCGAALATGLAPVRGLPDCAAQTQFNRTSAVAVLMRDPELAKQMAERSIEAGRRCVW
jgi:hypothetical protein